MRAGRTILSCAAAFVLVAGCSSEIDGSAHSGPQTRVPPAPAPAQPAEPAAPSAPAGPPAATRVVTVVAVDPAGRPLPGWTVEPVAGEVDCSYGTSLVAKAPDIVFCSPSAAGADVCWVGPDRSTVLCGTDPWERKLLRYGTGAPVPPAAPAQADPWAVELSDGARCRIRNGGAWGARADDLVGAYFCDRPEYVLVPGSGQTPAVDTSGPVWTVRVGDLGDPAQLFPPPRTVSVVTAYFAGR